MKFAKHLTILLFVTFFISEVSAGGDNFCDSLHKSTKILPKFQNFEAVYKLINESAYQYLADTLNENDLSVLQMVFKTTASFTKFYSAMAKADLSISIDTVTSAVLSFLQTYFFLPSKRDRKFAELKIAVNQVGILCDKIEVAIFESTAKIMKVSASDIFNFLDNPSSTMSHSLSCISTYMKHFRRLKTSILLELTDNVKIYNSLIANKFPAFG